MIVGCQAPAHKPAGRHWASQAAAVASERLNRHKAKAPISAGSFSSPGVAEIGLAASSRRNEDSPPSFMLTAWPDQPLAAAEVTPLVGEAATTAPAREPPPSEPGATIERGPLPGFGQSVKRDVKQMPGTLWNDTKNVYTNTGNLIILGLAGGASIALRPEVDDDIADHYDKHHTFTEDWRDTFGALGNPGTHFAVAGVMYLVGQQMPSTKTYEVGRTLFSALIINDVSTVLLKLAACDESPNGEDWAWPSGHVSSTATLAAVMHEAYGPLAGIPLYGLTGLVAVERMDDREHWFSDVVFGAAMGWVIGHTVASGHRPEMFGGEIVPYADPKSGGAGVAWVKSFD